MKKLQAKLKSINGARVLSKTELKGVLGIQGGSGGCDVFPPGQICSWECLGDGDCGDGGICFTYYLEGEGWRCECRRCKPPGS